MSDELGQGAKPQGRNDTRASTGRRRASAPAAPASLSDRDAVGPDDPLRLDVAAAIAFKDGSMTEHGLRTEAKNGRLAIERIAGKDYTTLAAIAVMRGLCRVDPKARTSGCGQPAAPAASCASPDGSSNITDGKRARAALQMTLTELRGRSSSISIDSIKKPRPSARVIRLKSE